MIDENKNSRLYFVLETKGSTDLHGLHGTEGNKIRSGKEHFAALGTNVRFDVANNFDAFVEKVEKHGRQGLNSVQHGKALELLSDKTFEISIPTDNDGFCLLQCPTCGEFFKLRPADIEDEGVLEIRCPACGLVGDSYLTKDVIELGMTIAKNYENDLINDFLKDMEKSFKGSVVSFKAGKKTKPEPELPIRAGIEALAIAHFPCCNKEAKIKPLLKITGCYCPFCGVIEDELE